VILHMAQIEASRPGRRLDRLTLRLRDGTRPASATRRSQGPRSQRASSPKSRVPAPRSPPQCRA
jgi:hypothetical protein